MCLFPLPNSNISGLAYKKGVHEFDCGACPECMRKRSNIWALRSVYEARSHAFNCMITLTYDNFIRDPKTGKILGETPVDRDLRVNKRDVQLFIKRLRAWHSTISCEKIKYLACAEYGSTTHRAHYHIILFGVHFPDLHFYKKSKRGNSIYMSNILTNLWKHGICTVDCINVHSAVARYCTKYCAKSRSENTFMLASQRIGLDKLLEDFNGINYMIDGREYPIPRVVWQEVILRRYGSSFSDMSYKYVNYTTENWLNGSFERSKIQRSIYRAVRDSDPQYSAYLSYWQQRGELFDSNKLSVRERIYLLNEGKFHFYKISALRVLDYRKKFIPFPAPGSNCVSAYFRYRDKIRYGLGIRYKPLSVTCRFPSRPNMASDNKQPLFNRLIFDGFVSREKNFINLQLSLDI
ncbi:replication initiator protein [Sigmofec virus UA08Rod_5838]|uniref:Replication initiator protein n=1 Tax=Sigmofec virus UA08Rod_5838 TaxID=2929442 RepID=A0A976N0U6_9VIRU|nr:replication initiator protein [Sigmofec virus UA08Rod_5838]